jgi:hypothetical protein
MYITEIVKPFDSSMAYESLLSTPSKPPPFMFSKSSIPLLNSKSRQQSLPASFTFSKTEAKSLVTKLKALPIFKNQNSGLQIIVSGLGTSKLGETDKSNLYVNTRNEYATMINQLKNYNSVGQTMILLIWKGFLDQSLQISGTSTSLSPDETLSKQLPMQLINLYESSKSVEASTIPTNDLTEFANKMTSDAVIGGDQDKKEIVSKILCGISQASEQGSSYKSYC